MKRRDAKHARSGHPAAGRWRGNRPAIWRRAGMRRCWRRCWPTHFHDGPALIAGRRAGDAGHQRQWRARAGPPHRARAMCRFSRWGRRPRRSGRRPALSVCAMPMAMPRRWREAAPRLGRSGQQARCCMSAGEDSARLAGRSAARERLHGPAGNSLCASTPRHLPPEARRGAAGRRARGGAVLFAPQRRRLFATVPSSEALPTAGLIAVCISPATAAALAPLAFARNPGRRRAQPGGAAGLPRLLSGRTTWIVQLTLIGPNLAPAPAWSVRKSSPLFSAAARLTRS